MDFDEIQKRIDELDKLHLPIIEAVKKKGQQAYHEYKIINLEYAFRRYILEKLKTSFYFPKEKPNIKNLVGRYFRTDEVNPSELKMFSELELIDYKKECADMGELADLLIKESVSLEEAKSAVIKFGEYGFCIRISEGKLAVEKYPGQCLDLGFSYNSEYFNINIK